MKSEITGIKMWTSKTGEEGAVELNTEQTQRFLNSDPEELARQFTGERQVDPETGEILDDPVSQISRQLHLGPDELFPAPTGSQFGGRAFMQADDDLEPIANALIDQYVELEHLQRFQIGFLWRKKGGASKGRPNYGKVQLNSGLLTHYSDDDAICWVAADNVIGGMMTNRQVMALLYSLLLQLDENEETGALQVIAPEVSVFSQEIRRFGVWWPNPENFTQAVQQLDLFGN